MSMDVPAAASSDRIGAGASGSVEINGDRRRFDLVLPDKVSRERLERFRAARDEDEIVTVGGEAARDPARSRRRRL